MNLFIKILWRFVLYSILVIGGVSLYIFLISIRPPRHVTGLTPSDLGMTYEDIRLLTSDGIELAGWFIPAKKDENKAIIVCHGYPADKGDVLSVAHFLHDRFHLLFFDFRAMGKSAGSLTTCGWREREDFLQAVRYIKSRGIDKIGAFGFSMGGAVIIMANSPDVGVIVTESSYASLEVVVHQMYKNFGALRYPFVYATRLWSRIFFGTDINKTSPSDYIGKINAPILLIHSEFDSQIPLEHAHRLKKANPQAELWVVEKADHGQAQALRRGEYKNRIINFFLALDKDSAEQQQ